MLLNRLRGIIASEALLTSDFPPELITRPAISGTQTEGGTLSVDTGEWEDASSYTYQWFTFASVDDDGVFSGTPISGATSASYQLTEADAFPRATTAVSGETNLATAAGLKTLTAVGSIPAASSQLTLTSNPGFQVGDAIFIEVGGESGAGARGTVGVGGVWPGLAYANAAARLAATPPPNLSYGYDQDTLAAFLRSGGAWHAETRYYLSTIHPIAHRTTISSIAGNVLTLAAPSVAAATSANVYFDNTALLNSYFSSAPTSNVKLFVPSGNYAISARVDCTSKEGWRIRGAGRDTTRFFSPKGAPSAALFYQFCRSVVVADLEVKGNVRNNGYGFYSYDISEPQYYGGLLFDRSEYCYAFRVLSTDVWQKAAGADLSSHCWAYNCKAVINDPRKMYMQWLFQWSDSYYGGTVDCEIDSNYLIPGFEAFRSEGVAHIRPISRNGIFAVNSSGAGIFDAPQITIEAMSSQPGDTVNSTSNFALSAVIHSQN